MHINIAEDTLSDWQNVKFNEKGLHLSLSHRLRQPKILTLRWLRIPIQPRIIDFKTTGWPNEWWSFDCREFLRQVEVGGKKFRCDSLLLGWHCFCWKRESYPMTKFLSTSFPLSQTSKVRVQATVADLTLRNHSDRFVTILCHWWLHPTSPKHVD